MIKLKYKKIKFKDLDIIYALYRKNRSIRISISSNKTIRVTAPYLTTETEIVNVLEKKEVWIRKTLSSLDKKQNLNTKISAKDREILKNRILTFIRKYELLMGTYVRNITIRSMKSLWGSCTFSTHDIRFNAKLYYMSDYFLEYIVVHEMAHIFVHNHSKKFYDIVSKYLPDYKKRWAEHKNVSIR